jgi:MATE family multidrug resistance protein
MQLFFIMTYSLDGFAHTAESLTGFTYGAKNRAALKQAVYYSGLWGSVLAIATTFSFYALGDQFIAGLTVAPEVRQTAGEYLIWVALAPVMCVWAFLYDGIFIGATRISEMRNAMFIAALVWAFVLYVTIDRWQYHAVWFAMNVFMLVRSGLLYLYYPRIERGASEF